MEKLQIINGKLISDDYPHDFHIFFHDKTIELYVFLPGINSDSVIIKNTGEWIKINVYLKKEYYPIFRSKTIEIEGNLPCKTHKNAVTTEYRDGILVIELIKDSS